MPNFDNVTISSNVTNFNTCAKITSIINNDIIISGKLGGVSAFTGDFNKDDEVLIHNTLPANTSNNSQYEIMKISSINGNTISLNRPIPNGFEPNFCQIVKIPSFLNLTIPSGVTVSTFALNDDLVGGILAFTVDREFSLNGNVDMTGKGYLASMSTPVNGLDVRNGLNSAYWAGAGGTNRVRGGNAGAISTAGGGLGVGNPSKVPIITNPDLITTKRLPFGGAGGYGFQGHEYRHSPSMVGGSGGGIIFIRTQTMNLGTQGKIKANGNGGTVYGVTSSYDGGSGGGAGGTIVINSPTISAAFSNFAGCTGGGGGGNINNYTGSDKAGTMGTNDAGGTGGGSSASNPQIFSTNAIGAGGAGHGSATYSPLGHGNSGSQPPGGGGGGYGFLSIYTLTNTLASTMTPIFKSEPIFFGISFDLPYPDFPEKVENIILLREKTNEFRVNNGLSQIENWTEKILIRNVTPIRAVHWNEITQGILDTYVSMDMPFVKQEVADVIKEKVLPNYDKHKISDLKNRLLRIAEAIKN